MDKILIANRGEIAVRIMRTCHRLNIRSVAVYSEADRHALHVQEADESYCVGPSPVEESYLNTEALLDVAQRSGAQAIHPGYGFLSENPEFAEAVIASGLIWIGPSADSMRKMSSKINARQIALNNNVPVIPAFTLEMSEVFDSNAIVSEIGLPLLIKSSAGGGGIGMREIYAAGELEGAIVEARAQGLRQFGSGDMLLERLINTGRHIEVQLAGDQHGNLVHLFERDCSGQRRRQKILEEAPAPELSDPLRNALHEAALRLGHAVAYDNVGTVEFLVDGEEFFLLEMNTRLQVEHGVSEAICGVDLVEVQINSARGLPLSIDQSILQRNGHAIEARVYAEDVAAGFLPATGTIVSWGEPSLPGLRTDSGVCTGSTISHYYDGLLCKLVVHAETREEATRQMQQALDQLQLSGITTNQGFLKAVLGSARWVECLSISTIESHLPHFLETTSPTSENIAMSLAAATLWQFKQQPPAADVSFWPGARQYLRSQSWALGGETKHVNWRWSAAESFQFPDLGINVDLLSNGTASNELCLEINGQRRLFKFDREGDVLWLWESGFGNLPLTRVSSASAGVDASARNQCTSHGPGLVLRILVEAGQSVTQGEPLLVIESMKMESSLGAPCDGTVADLLVGENDLIESGQVLVTLEPQLENAS
jgi:acetyl/propionyl-CoA carboxylase alpha subunit